LHRCEAIAKMRWTVPLYPACSPDLAPSDCHLFDPIKDALHGRHFADENELKQSFCDVLQSQGREFYNTGLQHLIQHWQKCVENDVDFVGKQRHNCKRCMNHPYKFHLYCSYIFWEEKLEALLLYHPHGSSY
jgi:hypothetical protein